MMWNVCGLGGLECEVVQNGMVKSVWCDMVALNCSVVWNVMV